MSSKMLTLGLSGASCSGKTSIANLLTKVFPRCSVINQDTYYYDENCEKYIRDESTNLINWETLEAFNMEKMKNDIQLSQNSMKVGG